MPAYLRCRPARRLRRLARLLTHATLACGGMLAALPWNASAQTSAAPVDDFLKEEMPARPTPSWVQMVDQGERNPELRGLHTPAGVQVDIVAREPQLIDPVGMSFAEDGSLYVLEWREAKSQVDTTYEVRFQDGTSATVNRKTKDARDELKHLVDTDQDGIYDQATVVMNDLEYPSTVLEHDGWMYFPSVGHVIRRKQSQPNGPYDQEQEIIRGLCGYHHHQVSGLTLSADNWLYTTTGDDDNRAEGSDGSRATVLRTGAIFRSRPDGSQLFEFARGFRNPYRSIVMDEQLNWFHVDNDQEDGSKFQGVRLMHLLEGADYGWRLKMGAKCCRTDFDRGAAFGERPGMMPSMLKVGRGAPAGLLIYQQPQFPSFFRGLLIYPDCYRKLVRAFRVEQRGATFAVTEQFPLMQWDDDYFRPVQALAGPDGGIYILDWHTNSGGAGRSWGDGQYGRLYRLSWSGIEGHPARELGSRQTWSALRDLGDDQLFAQLRDTDFEKRLRAQQQLVKRGVPVTRWLRLIADTSQPATARALAIGAASQNYSNDVQLTLQFRLASDPEPTVRRLAAESIGHHATVATTSDPLVAQLLKSLHEDRHPGVRRAAALAIGQLASHYVDEHPLKRRISTALLDELLAQDGADVWLTDGILRGLERTGSSGVQRLVTLVTAADTSPEQLERAVTFLMALRERPAVAGLDAVLAAQPSPVNDDQKERLLTTYRQIQVDPPIDTSGVQAWIDANPAASAQLRVTALETLGMVGGADRQRVESLALALLADPDASVRQSAVNAIRDLRLVGLAPQLVTALADPGRTLDERREVLDTLSALRVEGWPFTDRADPGVELVQDDLGRLLTVKDAEGLHTEILLLLAQLDPARAVAAAEPLLESTDPRTLAAAIDVLGVQREKAEAIAQRFIAGQLPPSTLQNVAAALQKHVARDTSGQLAPLLDQLFKDGLQLTVSPEETQRIEELVRTTGDADRGKLLFLDQERTQCAKCHRLEGFGGQVGPDLTRVWETHSVAKLMESIATPSKEIKEGYATWTIETTAGQVYSGLKLTDNTREVVLRDTSGRDIRVPRGDIELLEASEKSLMPEGTVAPLQFNEFVDLLAFLKSQQAQASLRPAEE